VLFGEVRDDEMGVVLGGRDVRVAEQFLHVADVGSGSKEMRREAVPQRAGGDLLDRDVELFSGSST
jgi:hypothetical protein